MSVATCKCGLLFRRTYKAQLYCPICRPLMEVGDVVRELDTMTRLMQEKPGHYHVRL